MVETGGEPDHMVFMVPALKKTDHNKIVVVKALAIHAVYPDKMNQSYPDHESNEIESQDSKHNCRYCLDEDSCPVVRSKTKLMNILIDTGKPGEVQNIFTSLVEAGHKPSLVTYTTRLNAMTTLKRFQDLPKIISAVKERGMKLDSIFYNAVINAFSESGDMVSAGLYLNEMEANGFKPTTSTFTTLIKGYGIAGMPEESLKLMVQMYKYEMPKPNLKTYNVLIKAFCCKKLIAEARNVIDILVSFGLKPDVVTYNTIATALARNGETRIAELMIADMNKYNVRLNKRTCCIIVTGYIRERKMREALRFVQTLKDLDVHPSLVSFNTLVKGFLDIRDKDGVDQVLTLMKIFGIRPDVVTFSTIMNGWIEARLIQECREAFDKMLEAGIKPDMHTYGILAKGYVRSGKPEKAEEILSDIMVSDMQPNVVIFTTVIYGWCRVCNMDRAISIFEKMREIGIRPDKKIFMTLVRGYGRAKQPKKAEEILHMMEDEFNLSPSQTTFRVVADAWRASGLPEEASRVMCSMNLVKGRHQDEIMKEDTRIARLEKIYQKQPTSDTSSTRLQPPNAILNDRNVSEYNIRRSRKMVGNGVPVEIKWSRSTTKSTFCSHSWKFGARLSVTCSKHCGALLHSIPQSYTAAFLN